MTAMRKACFLVLQIASLYAARKRLEIERDALRTGIDEALDQQTATTDVRPVLDAIVSRRLLGGHSSSVWRMIDDDVELARVQLDGLGGRLSLTDNVSAAPRSVRRP